MVEEIIYTSAEKGLKQGSRGFCTVVSTAGMSLALAERLESMSGYRHAFPLHDPQASLNPVCFSHVTTRLAGKSLHVISRVADAGQDYTGRSNKLAHHLVIDNVASIPAGPARLISEPGVVVERWDGNVRNVPPRELRCAPLPASIPLVAWQNVTGDEGWAGAVAEQLLQSPAPVSIIFNPGTDTLTLAREVLDLVPAAQRWNVTFSTYFTRLLAGAECQLRFVLNDTPEATSLRNDARARVIDLTSSLPSATGGTLVSMARKGQLTPQEPAPAPVVPAVRSRTAAEISIKETAAEVTIPKPKPSRSSLETPDKPQPPRDVPPPMRGNSRKGVWIGLTLAMITVTVTGVLIFIRPSKNNDPFADLVNKAVPQDQRQTEDEDARIALERAEIDRRQQLEREKAEKLAADVAARKKADDEKKATEKKQLDDEAQRRSEDAMAKASERAKRLEEDGPFAFIKSDELWKDKHGQMLLKLPIPRKMSSSGALPLRLSGKPIELGLCTEAESFFERVKTRFEIRRSPTSPSSKWQVIVAGQTPPLVLGEYAIEPISSDVALPDGPDHSLIFTWLPDRSRDPDPVASELFRWWPIEIKIEKRRAVLLQRTAFEPETKLTWQALVHGKPFRFSSNSEIKVLPFKDLTELSLAVSIHQPGAETQQVQSIIAASTATPDEDDDEAVNFESLSKPNARYFELGLPLRLHGEKPTKPIRSDSLGFGIINIEGRFTEEAELTLNPKILLTLRLPKRDVIRNLPSQEQIEFLSSITADVNKLAEFNPAVKDDRIETLAQKCAAIMKDPLEWHSQRFIKLTALNQFNTDKFSVAKKNAAEVVQRLALMTARPNPTRREQAMKDNDQSIIREEADREKIHSFNGAMGELEKALDENVKIMMASYDSIKSTLQQMVSAAERYEVTVDLTREIKLSGSENANQMLKIYFIETSSVMAR